jgi:hypothetical protein
MGIFNFVENFFFISLGITFVLILLLVYHFKQRMSSVERKGDTMFELMSNVVKEINVLKNVHSYYDHFFTKSSSPLNEPVLSYNIVDPVETMEIHNQQMESSVIEKQSDLEEVDSDDETVSNADSNAESSVSESDDAVSENDDSDADSDTDSYAESVSEEVDEKAIDPEADIFSHAREMEEDRTSVRIHLEQVQTDTETLVDMDIDVLPEDISALPVKDSAEEPSRNSESSTDFVKIDDIPQELPLSSDQGSDTRPKDHYRRLNLQQLKTAVQTLGLQVDVSKMKKNDIVKVLESASI